MEEEDMLCQTHIMCERVKNKKKYLCKYSDSRYADFYDVRHKQHIISNCNKGKQNSVSKKTDRLLELVERAIY